MPTKRIDGARDYDKSRRLPEHKFQEAYDLGTLKISSSALSREYYIRVVFGFDNVSRQQAIEKLTESSSPRVVLQKHLRDDTKEEVLAELEETGVAVHVNNVNKPFKTKEEEREEALAAWAAFPQEVRDQILAERKAQE